MSHRPPVSVVLPFAGTRQEAEEAAAAMASLQLSPGDELILVDNTPQGAVGELEGVKVVPASREPSSYYARNEGWAVAAHEWIAFIDADCRPRPDLLDRYFDREPADGCGALVGEVEGIEDQEGLVAAYARSRGHLGQRVHVEHAYRPWGVTANMLVRRAALHDVGGFQEGVRSGGDTEFSWRLQDAGWTLEYRPEAVVRHEHRASVRALARQAARYAAGRRWVMSRYPGSFGRPTLLAELARSAAGLVIWPVAGQPRRGVFKVLDGVYVAAGWGAFVLSNTPPGRPDELPAARVAAVAGVFPDLADAGPIQRARGIPGDIVVDATARPVRVDRPAARDLTIAYSEDDGYGRRLRALAWLLRRSPAAAVRLALRGPEAWLLATRARRLARAGVRELVPLSERERADAEQLAALTGARVA